MPKELPAKKEKRRKMREKKTEKLKKGSVDTEEETQEPDSATKALEYLNLWKKEKSNWSFQKVRQIWLLQHTYEANKVSDSNFSILLEYLEGLKGKGREMTIKQAENIITAKETDSEAESLSDADTEILEQKMDRAKQVLQLLS